MFRLVGKRLVLDSLVRPPGVRPSLGNLAEQCCGTPSVVGLQGATGGGVDRPDYRRNGVFLRVKLVELRCECLGGGYMVGFISG